MTLSDKMFIIKHKLITKRNIILIIVFSVLLTVIMGCITVINLVINFKYDTFNSEIGRTLIIYFIIYFIAQNTILVEFVYNNYTLPIPYLYLILLVAIFLLVFIKFENRIITKILDKDVQYLLER